VGKRNLALTSDHRQLYYLSRDFNRHAEQLDEVCALGPVMTISIFTAAAAIGNYLTSNQSTIDAPDIPRMLAMPRRHCPDPACLCLGMELFRKKYHPFFRNALVVNDLIRIGRLSWIEKMNRRQTIEQTEIESEDETVQEQFVWTPESVVTAFESIVRHCGFLLRRARWLTMLSEATISWKVRDPASDMHNCIILSKGGVVERYFSNAKNSLPVPPGAGLRFKDRQANLRLHTYDRLRVLTTEIRRLVAEHRPICIRLYHKVYLHEDQLQRVLKWI
jgi:hypothetical protein